MEGKGRGKAGTGTGTGGKRTKTHLSLPRLRRLHQQLNSRMRFPYIAVDGHRIRCACVAYKAYVVDEEFVTARGVIIDDVSLLKREESTIRPKTHPHERG